MALNKHGQLNAVFTLCSRLNSESSFSSAFFFNFLQEVFFFGVQKGVNGSQHLLHMVLIIIKCLWGVEALHFVGLERHPHTLWTSDDVQLLGHIPTAWHRLADCILYMNVQHSFSREFFSPLFSFAAL